MVEGEDVFKEAIGFLTNLTPLQPLEWDENLAKASKITLVVQINGKVKDKIEADEALGQDELKELALSSPKVKELTAGKTIVKTIVVPKKLVNIVIK